MWKKKEKSPVSLNASHRFINLINDSHLIKTPEIIDFTITNYLNRSWLERKKVLKRIIGLYFAFLLNMFMETYYYANLLLFREW